VTFTRPTLTGHKFSNDAQKNMSQTHSLLS
jgi:hypothetical protein